MIADEKCPYCGEEMYVIWATNPDDKDAITEGEFECDKCEIHIYMYLWSRNECKTKEV